MRFPPDILVAESRISESQSRLAWPHEKLDVRIPDSLGVFWQNSGTGAESRIQILGAGAEPHGEK